MKARGVRPGARVSDVQARLAATLPSTLLVAPPLQRGALYESILSSFQAMLTGLSLLCLVAGIYIIYNTTSTGAVQRALVLASLRLAGADPAQLLRLLMLEACILGALGTALGIPLGLGLGVAARHGVHVDGGDLTAALPAEHLAIDPRSLVCGRRGIAAALFASWFAARRVTSLEPLRCCAPTRAGRQHAVASLRGAVGDPVAMSAIALALGASAVDRLGQRGLDAVVGVLDRHRRPLVHATSSGWDACSGGCSDPRGRSPPRACSARPRGPA